MISRPSVMIPTIAVASTLTVAYAILGPAAIALLAFGSGVIASTSKLARGERDVPPSSPTRHTARSAQLTRGQTIRAY